MGERHLEIMGLSRERVTAVYRFRESYGEMCIRDLLQLSDQSSRKGRNAGAESVQRQQYWNLQVEAASSFTEAAQWAMLIDPIYALRLWQQAGRLYRDADFGFGFYLSALSQPPNSWADPDRDDDLASGLSLQMRNLADAGTATLSRSRPESSSIELPVPLRHPQQQAYLLLAATSLGPDNRTVELQSSLLALLERSPHRNGITPVGALGTPIGTLWSASALLASGHSDGLQALLGIIVELARRYDESMRQAMVNEYLWSNGAAAVDVGDADIAGLTISAFHAFSPNQSVDSVDQVFRQSIAEITGLARAQVEIAMELAHASYGKGH